MSMIDLLSPTLRLKYIDIEGIRVRYYDTGSEGVEDAIPLIMIHGTAGAADHYARNLAGLGEHRRVLVPDLLGHGFTAMPDGYENEAPQILESEHVLRFIDALSIDHFAIAGSSFGALVASLVALDRPDKCDRLILISSGSVFHTAEARETSIQGAITAGSDAFNAPTPTSLRKRHAGIVYKPDDDLFEETFLLRLTFMSQPGREGVFQWLVNGALATATDDSKQVYHRLEDLTMKTLVVTGKNDPRCNYKAVEEEMVRFPDAEHVLVEDSGHLPFAEQTVVFDAHVNAFLKGI